MKLMTKVLRVVFVAVTALPLLTAAPGGVENLGVSAAFAETTTVKVNAPTLLANIKRGLGTVLVGYKKSSEGKTKANGLVIKSTGAAATEVAKLEKALKSKKSKDISRATKAVSVAIGTLQSTYKLARVQDPTVAEGMRSVSSNWAAYSARFGLAKADKRPTTASAKQIAGLKQRINAMDKSLSRLASQAANSGCIGNDLVSLLDLMAGIRSQKIVASNYQDVLFRLSVLNGWYLGYAGFSEYYYPDCYYYFEDGYYDFASYDAYWDGYYDGYYASWPYDYYDRDFYYPDVVNLYVDNSIYEQTNIYVDNSVTVFNTEVAAEAASYEVTEASVADIPEAEAAMKMESAADEAAVFAMDAQPAEADLSEIEAADAPIDDAAFAQELASESDALIEADAIATDETAVEDPAVTDETVTDETVTDETYVEDPAVTDETATDQTYVEDPAAIDGTVTDETYVEDPVVTDETYVEQPTDAQTYEDPAPAEPTYEDPPVEEPVYEEPAYQEPVYEEPVYEEPAYEEPAPQQECTEEYPCE